MSQAPLVGIEVDLEANAKGRRYAKCYEAYFDAVVQAGGVPVLLPPCPDAALRRLLARVDAVVVPGGDDFHAREWGDEQRECERFVEVDARRLVAGKLLLDQVLASGRPYLGICYGMQLLNVVQGGSLVQDIPQEVEGHLEHGRTPHGIQIEGGSLLDRLVGERAAKTNSRHHQAVLEPGAGLRICARAPDGVVEAIEGTTGGFVLGVQWHCEELGDVPTGLRLFEGLVDAARAHALSNA